MSELKFTPGPWIYESGRVFADKEKIKLGGETFANDNYCILEADRSGYNNILPHIRDNNLKLAAKSPEMYELIKFIAETLSDKEKDRQLKIHEGIILNSCLEILKQIK